MSNANNTSNASITEVGIIGAGAIGQAMAGQLVRAGLKVIVSNSRGADSLAPLVAQLGPLARAASAQEAANAEVVFISVNWDKLAAAVKDIDWTGRIVIDANNPVLLPGYRLAELGGRNSSQVVADLLPRARLVKAFNTLPAAVLASDARQAGGSRVVFLSGDDSAAKSSVAQLSSQLGFTPVDLGSLAVGGALQQFPGGPLPGLNLIKLA